MKYLFYAFKVLYLAVAGLFLWRVYQMKKEDRTARFGLNTWALLQILFNGVLVVFGIYARYTEETKVVSWIFQIVGLVILCLLCYRVIICGDKLIFIKGKTYETRHMGRITAGTMSVVFQISGQDIKVVDYVGSIAELVDKYYDRVHARQQKADVKKEKKANRKKKK